MKILHTADLHLGKLLEGRSRLAEQEALLEELCQIAEEEKADLVLLAGDIYDGYNPSAQAEKLFFAFLRQLSAGGQRAVAAIAGNHDQPQRLAAVSPLLSEQSIYLLGSPFDVPPPQPKSEDKVCLLASSRNVLRLYLPLCREEAVIAALPYISEGRLNELFTSGIADESGARRDYQENLAQLLSAAAISFDPTAVNIVMAHLFLRGGLESDSERRLAAGAGEAEQAGGSYGVSAGIFPAGAQYVALGHLHRPQSVPAAMPCVYAGSPLAYSFSEANQSKSVALVEVSPGSQAVYRRRPLQAGYTLTRYPAASYDEALAWCAEPANHNYWVRLEIEAAAPLSGEELARLKEAHPRLLGISLNLPQMKKKELAESLSQLSAAEKFSLFARQSYGQDPPEGLTAMFLALLEDKEEDEYEAR
ncbi:MAG: exonuclease subunit SbcD [Clostridiales bacterium]|nr:exonuclease subunit SbcD [Clostridiales bacterium]